MVYTVEELLVFIGNQNVIMTVLAILLIAFVLLTLLYYLKYNAAAAYIVHRGKEKDYESFSKYRRETEKKLRL